MIYERKNGYVDADIKYIDNIRRDLHDNNKRHGKSVCREEDEEHR
jgi:hypothetical protein